VDEAFHLLRGHARNTGQTVGAVARQVIDGDLDLRS
jgi:AmiR/NasT family two-component response regulator